MEVILNEDQIFYWPKESDYNFRWYFDVIYNITLSDNKTYKFKTKFIYHSKKNKIYYKNITDYIEFKDIDWDFEFKEDKDGNIRGFGSTTNFIFRCTKYIGEFEIDDDKRDNVFNGTFNPFKFPMEKNNNMMGENVNIFKNWWINSEIKIISEIISKKDFYNSLISKSFDNLKL